VSDRDDNLTDTLIAVANQVQERARAAQLDADRASRRLTQVLAEMDKWLHDHGHPKLAPTWDSDSPPWLR
jgi:hypothetical protein